jgi:hypothetical protein
MKERPIIFSVAQPAAKADTADHFACVGNMAEGDA